MENWPDYVEGKLDIIPVSGEHATLLFEPYVKELAEAINKKVARALAGQAHLGMPFIENHKHQLDGVSECN